MVVQQIGFFRPTGDRWFMKSWSVYNVTWGQDSLHWIRLQICPHIGYTVWTNLCSRWSWSAGITDVWQYRLSVTSWTYGAFLSVSFHRCHPSRCQSPARCRRWLMGLADPIFCIPLMSLMPWLLAANFDRRL